jgi:hypothetical protein
MDCIRVAFCDYVQVLDKQTFEKGYAKQEKILNQFIINSYIRVGWINEFSDRQMDATIFKNFCDGKITTTSLFKDGQNTIFHNAKAWNTMNTFPKIFLDGGSKRRIDAITGNSLFVDSKSEVDENHHKYLKDKEIFKTISSTDDILNAIIDIIVKYSIMLSNGEIIDTTKNENMVKTRNDIINSNDNMSDFIDSQLILTNCGDDKINKNDMLKRYKKINEKSLISLNQLISTLKQSSTQINYNTNIRNEDGTRGAFIGVQFNKINISNNKEDDSETDFTVDEFMKMKNKCAKQEDQIKYLLSVLAKHKIDPDEKNIKIESEEETIITTTTTTTKKINAMPPIIDTYDEIQPSPKKIINKMPPIEKKPKKG